METAARSVLFRPELVDTLRTEAIATAPARTLAVATSYVLSEEGRKALLLAGGDGRAIQHIEVQVPANRLHLVTVNGKGVARLKLRPRYELNAEQHLVCIDAMPIYDTPPTTDDLLRDAARNHQLERAFHAERTAERAKRTETERARRTEIALAFLGDDTKRALIEPSPSPKRCFLRTKYGDMRFDVDADEGPARDVPRQALRRFRADVKAARERRERSRTEDLRIHEDRRQTVDAWVAQHGTDDQRARHAAGLLPFKEASEAMTDAAFQSLIDWPRYTRDGTALMQAHVKQWTGRTVAPVGPNDYVVFGHPARNATSHQWDAIQNIQSAVPDAVVNLHLREYIWRRNSGVPRLTQVTAVVTKKHGPFTLRREYVLPDEANEKPLSPDAKGALIKQR
jgi:hypothetical protein